jgi:2'-5' RNA ligase
LSRLFVAIWPPASLVDQLRGLERPARPGVRWTTERQWHVTLRFLGDMDAAGEEALHRVLGEVSAAATSVEAAAGPRPGPLGPGVWVLPVDGLRPLATRLEAATRDLGQPPPHRPFRGHLTLARARRPGLLHDLPEMSLGERWIVTDLTLVRSHLGAGGSRYEVIGTWPVGG